MTTKHVRVLREIESRWGRQKDCLGALISLKGKTVRQLDVKYDEYMNIADVELKFEKEFSTRKAAEAYFTRLRLLEEI